MSLFHRRPKLGRSSVKEAFDNLPSGICFADRNGVIILCNRQMHRLCRQLLGTDLQHIEELHRALKEPQSGVTAADESAPLFRFPDGKLWQFAENAVTDAGGGQYTQVQAMDVTELHEKRAELERENQALRALYELQQQYLTLNMEGCAKTIQKAEADGLPAALSDKSEGGVTSPAVRWQQLRDAVVAKMEE